MTINDTRCTTLQAKSFFLVCEPIKMILHSIPYTRGVAGSAHAHWHKAPFIHIVIMLRILHFSAFITA